MAQELIRIPHYCAHKYSNTKISIFNKFLILKLLLMLKKISARDKGSDELLCFGLHILAKKLAD
jgi:hypothetical protein